MGAETVVRADTAGRTPVGAETAVRAETIQTIGALGQSRGTRMDIDRCDLCASAIVHSLTHNEKCHNYKIDLGVGCIIFAKKVKQESASGPHECPETHSRISHSERDGAKLILTYSSCTQRHIKLRCQGCELVQNCCCFLIKCEGNWAILAGQKIIEKLAID
jgi:hypothetical protein